MKTSNMKKTAGLLALLILFGGAEAIAQSGTNKGSTGQTINGGIPQAPIGARCELAKFLFDPLQPRLDF